MPASLLNAMMFNLSWFAIILTQSALLAPVIALVHLLLHFRLLGAGKNELALVVWVTLVGMVLDQLLFLLGVFNLSGQPALAPLWLACLWPVFATTLMHAFAMLRGRVVLAIAVGALGGAFSYMAGVRLSAVEFGAPVWGPFIVGATWAILFPTLLLLATKFTVADDALQAWDPGAERALD